MSRVCFGDFALDPETRELLRGRDSIALSPKAYQLLEILVVSRPKALSKMALQEHLWPDAFVVEKNLVNLIAEIRKALEDDPTHPRFVRTVHRFGYAFREPAGATTANNTTVSRRTSAFASFGRMAVRALAKASTCWVAILTSSSSSTRRVSPAAMR